jgi:hypothetical protein
MTHALNFLSEGWAARWWSGRSAVLRLQLLPLIGREHGAKSPEHARVGFFQFHTRFGHAIELGQNARLLRAIGREQRVENSLFSFERSREIDQLEPVLLKDFFDFPLLIFRQTQPLNHRGIEPPLAFCAIAAGRPATGPTAKPSTTRLVGRRGLLAMKGDSGEASHQQR